MKSYGGYLLDNSQNAPAPFVIAALISWLLHIMIRNLLLVFWRQPRNYCGYIGKYNYSDCCYIENAQISIVVCVRMLRSTSELRSGWFSWPRIWKFHCQNLSSAKYDFFHQRARGKGKRTMWWRIHTKLNELEL